MTDIWVYSCQHPDLDQDYIKGELKKLGLDQFYENIIRTLQTWFEDLPEDAVTETITQHILSSGVYGTHTNRVLSDAAKETRNSTNRKAETIKRGIANVFPSCKTLQTRGYPILQKWPVLLPFVWMARWLRLIFVYRDGLKLKLRDLRDASAKNVDAFEKKLEFVGIRFPNKE